MGRPKGTKDKQPRKRPTKEDTRVALSTRVHKKAGEKIKRMLTQYPDSYKTKSVLLDAMILKYKHREGVEL